ncbi:MAG: PAS domain S-box protein, partial [Desulfosalsimonadaceae bacterium]|nr:PAS domain S-box protein [Desulfosalsimonadaceae bacterium]
KKWPRPVYFHVEYMDTRRIANDAYLKQLPQFYKEKYRGIHVDLILSSDDGAFDFLNQYRKEIFPDIPYVFCGVNYFEPNQIKDHHHITGVNETAGIRETLALIFHLHPQTEKILIINDQTISGMKVREPLLREIGLLGLRARFEFTDHLTYPEILEKVKNLNNRTVILFTFFFRDAANQFFENSDVISLLKTVSPVPIYGAWDFNLGLGIVGGMLTSGYYQGQKAAEIAINVLSGADIDQMGVTMESPNRYFFDYNLLKQHGISRSNLPKDSIIINTPATIYDFYKKNELIVLISLSIFLSTIVGVLLLGGFKIRRTHRKLTLSEKKYRSIFEHTGTAMMMVTKDTTITMVNSEFEILSGYQREEVELKKSWQQFVHKADKKKMLAYHKQRRAKEKSAPLNYEFRFINKQGKERHVFVTVGMIQGTDHSVASLLDITDRIRIEKEKEYLIAKLQHALNNIKTLKGLVPICAHCKKIRNDEGYWRQIEEFIQDHSDAQFSHGICPDCAKSFFPEFYTPGPKS